MATDQNDERERFMRGVRARHPHLREAVAADVRLTALHRGEPTDFSSRLELARAAVRLAVVSDAFLGQALYRLKARLQALGIPLLPRIAHRLAIATAGVSIGDPVVVAAGVYLLHGQVVIDGIVEIEEGVTIGPFVTIGLRAGNFQGPTLERSATIGTGAKVIGDVRVGAGSIVGANAVVVDDVQPGVTVAGVPARPLRSR